MSDELPTAARVSDPGIRALYRLENRWQAWLDVEAALAKTQEELGIIPEGAAEAIGGAARLELLDRARIDEGFARTGHTIVPLVWELSRVTGEQHLGDQAEVLDRSLSSRPVEHEHQIVAGALRSARPGLRNVELSG